MKASISVTLVDLLRKDPEGATVGQLHQKVTAIRKFRDRTTQDISKTLNRLKKQGILTHTDHKISCPVTKRSSSVWSLIDHSAQPKRVIKKKDSKVEGVDLGSDGLVLIRNQASETEDGTFHVQDPDGDITLFHIGLEELVVLNDMSVDKEKKLSSVPKTQNYKVDIPNTNIVLNAPAPSEVDVENILVPTLDKETVQALGESLELAARVLNYFDQPWAVKLFFSREEREKIRDLAVKIILR